MVLITLLSKAKSNVLMDFHLMHRLVALGLLLIQHKVTTLLDGFILGSCYLSSLECCSCLFFGRHVAMPNAVVKVTHRKISSITSSTQNCLKMSKLTQLTILQVMVHQVELKPKKILLLLHLFKDHPSQCLLLNLI